MRRMGWQLLINLLLTVGIFAFWAWVGHWNEPYLPVALRPPQIHDSLMWAAAMITTAPIYLASFRKVKAMGMLLGEICIPLSAGGRPVTAARAVISQVFMLVSLVVMTLITILLSTTILRSLESLVMLLLVVTVAATLFRSILLRLYSRAEVALHETLVQLPLLR